MLRVFLKKISFTVSNNGHDRQVKFRGFVFVLSLSCLQSQIRTLATGKLESRFGH
jgi:hypothetical protein